MHLRRGNPVFGFLGAPGEYDWTVRVCGSDAAVCQLTLTTCFCLIPCGMGLFVSFWAQENIVYRIVSIRSQQHKLQFWEKCYLLALPCWIQSENCFNDKEEINSTECYQAVPDCASVMPISLWIMVMMVVIMVMLYQSLVTYSTSPF